MLTCSPATQTHTDGRAIRSNLGFSILTKDTSVSRPKEPGFEPQTHIGLTLFCLSLYQPPAALTPGRPSVSSLTQITFPNPLSSAGWVSPPFFFFFLYDTASFISKLSSFCQRISCGWLDRNDIIHLINFSGGAILLLEKSWWGGG